MKRGVNLIMTLEKNNKNAVKYNLYDEMEDLTVPYKPKKLAILNERAWVELSLHKGAFPHGMHYHKDDDELFICFKGEVDIDLDGELVHLKEGEILHVKAGQKHMPVAEDNCYLLRIKTVPHMEAILEDGKVI